MKKNVLLSLLAASAPMMAFADANFPVNIDKGVDGWLNDGGSKHNVLAKDTLTSSGPHITTEITLLPGKYKLAVGAGSENAQAVLARNQNWASNDAGLVTADKPAPFVKLLPDGTYEVTKETKIWLRVCRVDEKVSVLKAYGVSVTLVYDFAAAAKTLDDEAVFNLKKVDKVKYPQVAEQLENEATRIKGLILEMKQTNNSEGAYDYYKKHQLWNGVESLQLWKDIQNLKKEIDDKADVVNRHAYAVQERDAVVALLNDVSFKEAGDAKDNIYAKETKGYDKERKALLEGLKKAFEGVDAYESDPNFTTTFSKENVDKIVKDYTAKKDALQANINKAIQNDKAYNAIVQQVVAVKNAYLAKQKELTGLMNANEGQKENVYEGLLQQATVKLADANRLVTNTAFNTMLGSQENHDTASENQQKMQDEINKANATISQIVSDYTKWYNDEVAAYKAQMAVVDGKSKQLVPYNKDTEETIALRKTAADAIAAFKQVLVDQNKAWNLAKYAQGEDYKAKVADIDAKVKAYTDKVGLDKVNFGNYSTLVENLTGLDKKLAEAKAAVAKMTYDQDGYKYNAANQNNTDAIDGTVKDKEGSLTKAKAKVGDAYKADTKYDLAWVDVKAIEGEIASYQSTAQASFDAYKEVVGNLAADKKSAAEFKTLVGEEGFVTDAAGKTYDVIVQEVEKKIADAAQPLADALAKQNADHQNALNGIYASQKDAIAGLKTQFAKDKAEYIKNTNIKDAIQLRDAAQAIVKDINKTVADVKKNIDGSGTKKDEFKKELAAVEAEVAKHQVVLDSYKNIDEKNSLEASAELGKVQKATRDLQSQIDALESKVNDQLKVVKAEQDFLKGLRAANGALGELKVTIEKIKTANEDASRNAEFEGLYNKVNALYVALDKEAGDSCVKEVLQARWIEYYKEKDPKGNAIRGMKGRCMDIKAEADKHVKAAEASTANWKAYNAVKKLIDDLKFVTADGKGSIAVAREQINNGVVVPGQTERQAITGAAQNFYLGEITKHENKLNDLKSQIDASYGEGKREMVAKRASYEKSLKDLSTALHSLPGKAAVNEKANNTLSKKSDRIETKLNEVITYVSENDKTSMRDEYLQKLTAQQKALINEDKVIATEWATGILGDKEAVRDDEYTTIEQAILKIESDQKNGYGSVVQAENKAYFDKFQAEYTKALGVHKVAVSKIEHYLNLQHSELRKAVWDNAKKHEVEIYDEMKLAKDLKATFEEAYAKNSSTGLVFEFPEETSFKTLQGHLTKIQGFTEALQTDAENDAKGFMTSKIADAKRLLASAQQELKDKSFATWESAFADVKNDIKAAEDFKVEAGQDYAFELDRTNHFDNLGSTSSKLRNGKETAADAEWAYFLKHDKVDLKADLENWKAAVGYYDSYWGRYTDGNFVYPETEGSQKRKDQKDYSEQYDVFYNYVNSYIWYSNVVSYKQEAKKAYDAAKVVYDRAAAMVQQREKSDAAYELLFNGVSGETTFDNSFMSLDAKKNHLDVYADAYNISLQKSWQGQMAQFESHYEYLGLKSEIESAKRSGTVHNALDRYKTNLNGYAEKLDKTQVASASLYKYADDLQQTQLEGDLETLKKELNRAVANSSHTIDFYDGLRERLDQYLADFEVAKKLAAYQAKTDKLAEATPKHDAFVKLEGEIAAALQEIRVSYTTDNDFIEVNNSFNSDIESLMNSYNRLNNLVESTETHDPVREDYTSIRDNAKQVLDEMNTYVDAHRDAQNKVLYYYQDGVRQAITKGENLNLSGVISSLMNDERAYDEHEAKYSEVNAKLLKYETYFTDVICAELAGYHNTYANEIDQVREDISREKRWLDRNKTGNNKSIFYGRGVDNGIYDEIFNLQKQAAQQEYSYRYQQASYVMGSVNSYLTMLLTPADRKEYQETQHQLQVAYQNMNEYHRQLLRDYVYVDIDGNDVTDYYGNPQYRPYVVLNGEVQSQKYQEVHKRADELGKQLVELENNLKKNVILRGDVDDDDQIIANDYMKVLGYILEDSSVQVPEDARERERFIMRANANGDYDENGNELVNIGDVVYVNNAIRGVNMTRKMLVANPYSLMALHNDNIALFAEGEGTSRRIAISLNNSIDYVGCQMDITLPEGVTLVGESVGDRASSHQLFSNDLENGVHRIVIASTGNDVFAGSEGAVIFLDVEVSHNYKGDGVLVSNVEFADAASQVYKLNSIEGGEATGIGTVTLTEELKSKVYNVGGQLMDGLKKGVNVILMQDGSVKKVIKK